MRTILINPDGDMSLKVTGSFVPGEEETNIPNSFLIFSVEINNEDISDILEWANSKEKGKILEYIEELVLEKI